MVDDPSELRALIALQAREIELLRGAVHVDGAAILRLADEPSPLTLCAATLAIREGDLADLLGLSFARTLAAGALEIVPELSARLRRYADPRAAVGVAAVALGVDVELGSPAVARAALAHLEALDLRQVVVRVGEGGPVLELHARGGLEHLEALDAELLAAGVHLAGLYDLREADLADLGSPHLPRLALALLAVLAAPTPPV
jgi:hypothetical protein